MSTILDKKDFIRGLIASKKSISNEPEKKFRLLDEKPNGYDSKAFKPNPKNEHLNIILQEISNQYFLNNLTRGSPYDIGGGDNLLD